MKTKRVWLVFLKGIALAAGGMLLLTALLALIAKNGAEDGTVSVLALLCRAAGLLTGVGYICRNVKKRGALCGLIAGAAYWAVCLALSFLFSGSLSLLPALIDLASCVAAAVFAGILFTNLFR